MTIVPFLYTVAFFLLALALGRYLQSSSLRSTQRSRSTSKSSKPSEALNPKAWFEQAKANAADKKIARNRDSIVEDLERQFNDSPSHNPDA